MDRASGLTSDLRCLLVEFFVALSQRYRRLLAAPANAGVVRAAVGLLLRMMCVGGVTGDPELDQPRPHGAVGPAAADVDASAWGSSDRGGEFGEEDLENVAAMGAGALDRFSAAVGAAAVLPGVFQFVGTVLRPDSGGGGGGGVSGRGDWRRRWAMLAAVTAVCSGRSAKFAQHVPRLVQVATQLTRDTHFFVQYAAVNFLYHVARQFRGTAVAATPPPPAAAATAAAQLGSDGIDDDDDDDRSPSSLDVMLKYGAALLPVLGLSLIHI